MHRQVTGMLRLMKIRISAMSSLAAFLGYTLMSAEFTIRAVPVTLSFFVLSAGASAMNNYQDREVDRWMERTCHRDLPAGNISPAAAALLASVLVTSGLLLLLISGPGFLSFFTGLMSVVLYNGLYTPLKKKTVYAFFPGVICGTLPVLTGWISAGGSILSAQAVYLMVLFGIWQVPHTMLILLVNRNDYMNPVIPSFLNCFSECTLERIVFTWASAFALLMLLLKIYLPAPWSIPHAAVILNGVIMPPVFLSIFFVKNKDKVYRYLFRYLSLSILSFIAALINDYR